MTHIIFLHILKAVTYDTKAFDMQIKVRKTLKRHPQTNDMCFQLVVSLADYPNYELFRTLPDLVNLEKKVSQELITTNKNTFSAEFPRLNIERDDVALLNDSYSEINIHNSTKQQSASENLLKHRKNVEQYLRNLIKKQLITYEMIYFLEIPEKFVQRFIKLVKPRPGSVFSGLGAIPDLEIERTESFQPLTLRTNESSSDEDKLKTSQSVEIFGEQYREDGKYCLFFNVGVRELGKSLLGDFIEYSIQISMADEPNDPWDVKKRYNDFLQLHENVKATLNIEPPILPKKNFRHDESLLAERRRGLELYLKILLNDKLYHCEPLWRFIQLKREMNLPALISKSSLSSGFFKTYRATITDTKIIFDKNSTKMCTYYIIMIESLTDNLAKCLLSYQIIKRYNEFLSLHEALIIRNPKMNAELPPKIDMIRALQTNINKDERKIKLQRYLNELFQIEGIEDCFQFRVFIEFETRRSKSFAPASLNEPVNIY